MIFIFKRPYWRVAMNSQAVKRMMHDNDFKDDDEIIDLSCTVCARWASGTDVVFGCRNTTAHLLKCTFSLSVSRAEVASSSSRILGSRMIALAMAMRCFWPRESCEPWAPTLVSYFCASRKECAFNCILDLKFCLVYSVFAPFMKCAPLPREGTWQRHEAGLS